MSDNRLRDTAPASLADCPFLSLVLLPLATMPAAQRNAVLSLVDFLNSLPKEELAIIAMTVQPHLTDKEIADLCGVCRRTLYNWTRYQSVKPQLADYLETKRRQSYMPEDYGT